MKPGGDGALGAGRSPTRRFALVACEIFYREVCAVVARSRHRIDLEFLPKGLHDIGRSGMSARVQDAVDRASASRPEAVLLGYGLCNNGVVGLEARDVPLIIPRAHDCIAFFLGSHERYLEYFHGHPGVYFLTSGWIERAEVSGDLRQLSIEEATGMCLSYEELVAKYGEDNAAFLGEELCNITRNYSQFTFIDMGVGPSAAFEEAVRAEAARRGWRYEKISGDWSLFERLADGPWDENAFLTVPPGCRVGAEYAGRIIRVELREKRA